MYITLRQSKRHLTSGYFELRVSYSPLKEFLTEHYSAFPAENKTGQSASPQTSTNFGRFVTWKCTYVAG